VPGAPRANARGARAPARAPAARTRGPARRTAPLAARTAAFAALLLAPGCNYGFQGGGGFPAHIRTLYIEPFENRTAQFDLETQLFRKLVERLPRALGVRPAARDVADAVVRGRIVRYDDVAQNYRPGDSGRDPQILEHQVQITISVEIIDLRRNVILWRGENVVGRGEYLPASQTDQVGREEAIEHLIQQIVDGAQSQW